MDGACPTSAGFPCFAFAEACRLRKKYWSAKNDEIGDIVRLMIARGCSKEPPPPDNPEAYLRTISVNLEGKLVAEDKRRKAIYEASREEGPLAEYARRVREEDRSIENPVEARDEIAFILSRLPDEAVFPFLLSTQRFFLLAMGAGLKPAELKKAFPDITVNEIKHHQKAIRETVRGLASVLGKK